MQSTVNRWLRERWRKHMTRDAHNTNQWISVRCLKSVEGFVLLAHLSDAGNPFNFLPQGPHQCHCSWTHPTWWQPCWEWYQTIMVPDNFVDDSRILLILTRKPFAPFSTCESCASRVFHIHIMSWTFQKHRRMELGANSTLLTGTCPTLYHADHRLSFSALKDVNACIKELMPSSTVPPMAERTSWKWFPKATTLWVPCQLS